MENDNIIQPEVQNETPVSMPEIPTVTSENKSSGALIGTIIVIVTLVLGGFYLWNTKVQPRIEEKSSATLSDTTKTDANTNATIEQLSVQATSDETASIESDLNATDLTNLDKDLQAI